MTIFDNPKKLANYLVERDITFKQFCFVYFLSAESIHADKYDIKFTKDDGWISFTVFANKYANQHGNWTKKDIQHLEKHGLLINKNTKDEFYQDNIEVTEKFLDLVFEKKPDDLKEKFTEFWNTYPGIVDTGDTVLTLRNATKEETFELYEQATQEYDAEDINKALIVAKSKNQVRVKITNFLKSEMYTQYMDEIDGVSGDESQVTTTII